MGCKYTMLVHYEKFLEYTVLGRSGYNDIKS